MRDNQYLEDMMYDLWENHFSDVPRKNLVLIKFGKYSRRQLGCIKLANQHTKIKGLLKKKIQDYEVQDDKSISLITVTRYFQDEVVPDSIVRATVAHELCHYTHGFSSPLEKLFEKPHQGNIVKKELARRGLLEEYLESEKWLKENWRDIVLSQKTN
jgi:hypothetical protein